MSTATSFPKEEIKVLLLEGVHPAAIRMFEEAGYTDLETAKGAMSEEDLLKRISQVHLLGIRSKTQLTKKVLDAGENYFSQPNAPEADAWVCTEPGKGCVIMTADCLPVVFVDEQAQVIACAHAGWRGLLEEIGRASCRERV